ncbi:MAG: MgtC/SapB family protein [Cellulosilyticum sp.]|nr:MgtC/SapB family protein [Cellulosilyticum sp.]
MNFLEDITSSFELNLIGISIVKLTLAIILGGIIGWEREHTNRPAGLRTHEVVCIGATLCMMVSEFVSFKYGTMIDPTRMGAQVISGIGFLGAGTIIKEGFSVKGLTTAASLWCVSCIGLAIGAGFYSGAIIATLFIYITLLIMKKVLIYHATTRVVSLLVDEVDEVYFQAYEMFKKFKCTVYSTEIAMSEDGTTKEIRFLIASPSTEESFHHLIACIRAISGVKAQHIE